MSEKKKIWEKPSVQIGIGVLLYFLLRGGNSDQKTKTENKPVDIKGNENEVTKGVKIQDVSLIRIDPTINISKWFKNSEYFGKNPVEVPKEHYSAWERLGSALSLVRDVMFAPVFIVKGYSVFKNGLGVTISAKDKDKLWRSINTVNYSRPGLFKEIVRHPNKQVSLTIHEVPQRLLT